MKSFFALLRSLMLPTNRLPGQSGILLGPDLPAPLDTYTFTEELGGGTFRYASAIIIYPDSTAPNLDTSYIYLAAPAQLGGPNTLVWHVGAVVNGAVVEQASGFPSVLQISESLTGSTADGRILKGGKVRLTATQTGTDAMVLTSDGGLLAQAEVTAKLTGDNADQYIELGPLGVSILAQGAGLDVSLVANRNVYVGSPIDWGGSTGVTNRDDTVRTTTSTSYVYTFAGAGRVGTAFVAPPSGKVTILYRGEGYSNNAAGWALISPEVREGSTVGSGTVVTGYGAQDANSTQRVGTDSQGNGSYLDVVGLTPGADYNVQLGQKSSNAAHTASYLRRAVSVLPAL